MFAFGTIFVHSRDSTQVRTYSVVDSRQSTDIRYAKGIILPGTPCEEFEYRFPDVLGAYQVPCERTVQVATADNQRRNALVDCVVLGIPVSLPVFPLSDMVMIHSYRLP